MGSMSGTARASIDALREKGIKAGAAKLTVFRPFPFDEVKKLSGKTKILAVLDRNISFGFGGAVFSEVAGALVNEKEKPILIDFILGLGGRDVTQEDFYKMADLSETAIEKGGPDDMVNWINLNDAEVQ